MKNLNPISQKCKSSTFWKVCVHSCPQMSVECQKRLKHPWASTRLASIWLKGLTRVLRMLSGLPRTLFSTQSLIVQVVSGSYICEHICYSTVNYNIIFHQGCIFTQRKQVKLQSRSKKCYFPSPLEIFGITMPSLTESFNTS